VRYEHSGSESGEDFAIAGSDPEGMPAAHLAVGDPDDGGGVGVVRKIEEGCGGSGFRGNRIYLRHEPRKTAVRVDQEFPTS